MKVVIEVEEPYSLDLSMSPSFISSLYVKLGPNEWAKIAGTLGGSLKLRQVGPSRVEAECALDVPRRLLEEVVVLELGAWHPPFEDLVPKLPSRFRWAAEALSTAYPGVRLPIAPHDFNHVFISVSLSRRANYERFVLRWCRRIWELFNGDLEAIARSSPEELAKVGSSYQVAQLREMASDLLSIPHRLSSIASDLRLPRIRSHLDLLKLKPEEARLVLLRGCRYLGPKAADALILDSFKAPHFIPCDVHLRTVARRLQLAPEGLAVPDKQRCSRYTCIEGVVEGVKGCPRANNCLRAWMMGLSEAGGWFQTLCYIHGSSTCRTASPRCSSCLIASQCPSAST